MVRQSQVSRRARPTIYTGVYKSLRSYILDNALPENHPLPSINELCHPAGRSMSRRPFVGSDNGVATSKQDQKA